MRVSLLKHLGSRRRVGLLACAFLVGCGGDGKTATGVDGGVASVVITGVPTSPLLVGDSVRLVATPVNASGGIVSNRAVSWRSSNAAIAIVSANGTVTAVSAGPVTITAAAEGKTGTTSLDVRAGGQIGTAGGTLIMLNGAATLTVPPNGLTQQVTVLFAPAATAPQSPRLVTGTAYELGPDGLTFSRIASLALKYDPAKVPSGLVEAGLQLYTQSGNVWALVPGSTVNTTTKTVTGSVFRSGTYAIVSTPVDHVTLGGALVGGALYTSQTAQFAVTVFDAANTVLTGRPISWTTSDASKAAVDGTGKVVAVAPGSVTITATSEGKSASTELMVLSRPTVDWSGATTEWTTYQGNAGHTGYVAASLDPVSFRELWVATVASNVALNPVTAGDGNVFASTNAYFGKQLFVTLDAKTGAQKWSKDFGAIHSVDPPAYWSGKVYVMTGGHEDSFLWGFEANTGAQLFRTPYGNQWSRWYAPVVIDGSVYTAGGYYGGMYRFNATDGKQSWFAQTNQYDAWSPSVSNDRVYAYTGSYDPKLDVVNATTGVSEFTIKDPRFSWNGWSMTGAPVLGSMNDVLAVQANRLVAFDLGARTIKWEQTGQFAAALTLANGVLYVPTYRDVEARQETNGSLVWTWKPPEGSPVNTVVATKNLLFVSTAANTYAVDLTSRRQMWSYPAGGQLALSNQGILFIAQVTGKLTAISVK